MYFLVYLLRFAGSFGYRRALRVRMFVLWVIYSLFVLAWVGHSCLVLSIPARSLRVVSVAFPLSACQHKTNRRRQWQTQ